MSRVPRFRPSQRMLPRWLICTSIVVGFVGFLSLNFYDARALKAVVPIFLMNVSMAATGFVLSGFVMLMERQKKLREIDWWREAAHFHGLQFDEQVTEADIEPFLDSPLFRFGASRDANAYSHTWGTIDRYAFSILTYHHVCRHRTGKSGKSRLAFEQTVALFLDVGLPDFHLAPHENDWDGLEFDWHKTLDLGEVVQIVNPMSNSPSILLAPDVAVVRKLFDSRRVNRRMGKLAGWTIESCNGNLVIYFHGDRRKYAELPGFIRKVIRVVNTLCTANATPGESLASAEAEPSSVTPSMSERSEGSRSE